MLLLLLLFVVRPFKPHTQTTNTQTNERREECLNLDNLLSVHRVKGQIRAKPTSFISRKSKNKQKNKTKKRWGGGGGGGE